MLKPGPHFLCPAQKASPEFADRVVVAAMREFEITRRWSRMMHRVSLGIAAAWLTALLGVGWDMRALEHESARREQEAIHLLAQRRTCGCVSLAQVEETSQRVEAILERLRNEDASRAGQACGAQARLR